jgi:hypothetical protein
MRQIFYVRPQEDRSWVVSRFGQPLAVTRDPKDAVLIGNKLARKASGAGCAAELRLAHSDRTYELFSVFEAGRGPGL